MILIIAGPPGAGKGTYSRYITQHFNVGYLSTGDELRRRAKEEPILKNYMDRGELVPDSYVIPMVEGFLEKCLKEGQGALLDGFPRNMNQARWLIEKYPPDKFDYLIIFLKVPDDVIIKKLSGRRICPRCGKPYNVETIDEHYVIDGIDYHFYLPPLLPKTKINDQWVCDNCKVPLIQRDDDRPEVIKARLENYRKQLEPVLKFLEQIGIKKVEFVCNRPPEEMVDKIIRKLEELGVPKAE